MDEITGVSRSETFSVIELTPNGRVCIGAHLPFDEATELAFKLFFGNNCEREYLLEPEV